MASTFLPKTKILPSAQLRLWPELIEVPEQFVLYGGTAIALQLAHRESVDFDFFGRELFDPDEILASVPFLSGAKVIQKSPNTLTALVERSGVVQVSFFGVPTLESIRMPHRVDETNLKIANLLDLAGTKAAVVQKRAEAKDYIDIDALIHHGGVGLSEALSAARIIYGSRFNPELTHKSLCFFGDGNLATVPPETRKRLIEAINQVDLWKLPDLDIHDASNDSENRQ